MSLAIASVDVFSIESLSSAVLHSKFLGVAEPELVALAPCSLLRIQWKSEIMNMHEKSLISHTSRAVCEYLSETSDTNVPASSMIPRRIYTR